jgi:hypothetical protein
MNIDQINAHLDALKLTQADALDTIDLLTGSEADTKQEEKDRRFALLEGEDKAKGEALKSLYAPIMEARQILNQFAHDFLTKK